MDPQLAYVIGIVFCAYLARSTFGFGDAVIAMPLLLLFTAPTFAAPLVALLSIVGAIIIAAEARAHLDWKAAGKLVLAAAPGLLVGVYALTVLRTETIQQVLGTLLVVYGLFSLLGPRDLNPISTRWVWPFGFVAGFFAGSLSAAGPPVVVFATLRRWDPQRIRATLQGYFLIVSIGVVITHAIAGLWTRDLFVATAASLPGMFIAIALGRLANQKLDPTRFRAALIIILIALGVLMWTTSLR